MIHVDLKPEPVDFDVRVRQPGNAFLSTTPTPNSKQWSKNNYWSRCSAQLYKHTAVCARIVVSGFHEQQLLFQLTIFTLKVRIRKWLTNGIITD